MSDALMLRMSGEQKDVLVLFCFTFLAQLAELIV